MRSAVPWGASFAEHGLACIYRYVVSFRVSCLRVTSVVRLSDVVSVVRWGAHCLASCFSRTRRTHSYYACVWGKNLLKCPPQACCSLCKASERAARGPTPAATAVAKGEGGMLRQESLLWRNLLCVPKRKAGCPVETKLVARDLTVPFLPRALFR